MTRREKPVRRASSNGVDPLDEALRQIGADMLDEPVPERLLQILRQAHGLRQVRAGEEEPESAIHLRPQGTDRG
jgi:hypothetical protein